MTITNTHHSHEGNLSLDSLRFDENHNNTAYLGKPSGVLWACHEEGAWERFVRNNMSDASVLDHKYEVVVSTESRYLLIHDDASFDSFTDKYGMSMDGISAVLIDWDKVSKDYDAVTVAHGRGGRTWHGQWDIPTTVIFSRNAIISLNKEDSTMNAISKMRASMTTADLSKLAGKQAREDVEDIKEERRARRNKTYRTSKYTHLGGSIVKTEYKSEYGPDGNCGDEIALALREHTRDDDDRFNRAAALEIARTNGIRYLTGTNDGQRAMNLGNKLRGLTRRGQSVVIGNGVYTDAVS